MKIGRGPRRIARRLTKNVASRARRPHSLLSHLECPRCARRHDADALAGLCGCGSPLLARYDLPAATGPDGAAALSPELIAGRPPTMWRYHELLPVRDPARVVTLGEGMTPLVPLPRIGARLGIERLLMKDEGLLPGGSFKARGAAAGVSRARELGARGIAMPTNGNAGAAWALYAARAGMRSLIAMPHDAPEITQRECRAAGAELHLVEGHIGTAAELVARKLAGRSGFADVATLREPYRVEGKKTMGYEIVEQLGWRTPDVIIYPTGGGVGLIGIHKALSELRAVGLLPRTAAPPRLVAVQAAGCAPIVDAYERGARESRPCLAPFTVAFGIKVPKTLGDFLVLDAIRETDGCAVRVLDNDILRMQATCARQEGAFLCPEGAATLAAARMLRESGWIGDGDEVVVLNTGSGLKYPDTF